MSETVAPWRDGYAVLAELWCSPQDVDQADLRGRAEALVPVLERVAPAAAASLARFLEQPVSEEEYLQLFELDPRCSLYLGSHSFEEPTTCAQAGVSDRNGYMIELVGIYRHLGLTPTPEELPDYLPLMIEFLALTAGSDDPVREKLIREYILPHLAPVRAKLADLPCPHGHLLDALERVLRIDVGAETMEDPRA